MSKLKPFFFALLGFLTALGVLSLSRVGPAQAQSPGVNLAALVAKVNTLQSQQQTDENTISNLKSQQATDEQTITSQGKTITSQGNTIASLQSSLSSVQSKQTTDEANITANTTNIGKLQTLTSPLSLSSDPSIGGINTLLTISGVNVQIVNGRGGTRTANGLGNLIIGYNEKDYRFTQDRSGSHNLVVGTGNNYLSYGGLIAGQNNLISAPYASVTGGQFNVASSGHASVSGGSGNTASGGSSSVSGGSGNTASGDYASVTGGTSNTASYFYASVTGGYNNTASGNCSSVTGGTGNTAAPAGVPDPYLYDNTTVSGGGDLTESTAKGWKAGSASGVPFRTEGDFSSD